MIVNANTLKAYEELLSILTKVTNRDALDVYLMVNLGTDVFGVWLAYEEDEVTGVIVTEAVDLMLEPKLFIAHIWAKNEDISKELLDRAEMWGTKRKLTKMILYSNRQYKKYQNYGFSLKRTVMEKEL